MSATRWTVFWSAGPVDNPDDGEITVEGNSPYDALESADRHLEGKWGHPRSIDAIVLSDLLPDLAPVKLRPIVEALAEALDCLDRREQRMHGPMGMPSPELQAGQAALVSLRELAGLDSKTQPP